jgi:hypothetical protein
MIAPELLLAKAWQDLMVAYANLRAMGELASQDETEWTLTHSLFADMGGFVIRGNTEHEPEALKMTDIGFRPNITASEALLPVQDTERGAASRSKSSISVNEEATTEKTPHHDPFHLTTTAILKLRRSGLLPKLPSITIDEIDDKNKSDAFARAISVTQITWISVQVVARAARRLAISQLEIAVLAFSACAIIIYTLNWKKPKGVSVPYTLLSFPGGIPSKIVRGAVGSDRTDALFDGSILTWLFGYEGPPPETLGRRVPNDSSVMQEDPHYSSSYDVFGLIIGTSLFGGLHATVWNFSFPTRIEQIIWRVSSVTCIIYIFTLFFCFAIFPFPGYSGGSNSTWVQAGRLTVRFISIVYVLARLFLIIEMFRTLCFLPPDAYMSTWAANIPHLA